MKKNAKLLIALALPLAFSCTQGGKNDEKKDHVDIVRDTVKQCYVSSFEGDSAILNINIINSIKVEGNLVINYAEKPKNDGIIRGEFKGDTLFVDYTFKIGEGATEFSNPLALLRKDNNLKLGVGQIETSYGRSYFVKGKPINFERGKFDFALTECK